MQNRGTENPVIGKHILSTLTIGMYQDPRMIYREYIQNSADQIDTLTADELQDNIRRTIVIDINAKERSVQILDRATGIPQRDFRERLLNVADSHKDPSKNKGFRGIGRLAGLNYCQKLIFETTAIGETVVSRLEMNAREMIRILHDTSDHSLAAEVIKKISKITYKKDAANEYDCFFKVILEDVRLDVGEALLDVESVKEFVAQIAPVPFSNMKFKIGKVIMEEAARAGVTIEEYTVRVNGTTITKLYKDILYDSHNKQLGEVGQPIFRMIEWQGKKLAWGWFILPTHGVSLAESSNPERKVRLRKGNIQIGFDNFLDLYFPESRSNGYMLGEIHLLSDEILPNGDRNALEVSKEASVLVEQLKKSLFRDMWNAAHKANELNNAKKDVANYKKLQQEVDELKRNGVSAGVEARKTELEKAYEKAETGLKKIKKAAGASGTSIKGEFVAGVVDVLANEHVIAQLQELNAFISDDEHNQNATLKKKVETTGDSLINTVVKVLVDGGIEPMRAFELAQKINEAISKTT